MDFFETITKLRAARRIWAKLTKERFGAKNPHSWRMRMHVQTSGFSCTLQQPECNLMRGTVEALAAALGGTNSLHIESFDEAYSLPTELSHRLSVRTQQILLHETGVADVIDPLAGSYYVEWLTNRIEEEAWKLIHKVDEMGGAIAAIENGYYLRELHTSVGRHQVKIDSREKIIVGVNEYCINEAEKKFEVVEHNPEGVDRVLQRLRQARAERDNERVRRALDELRRAATEGSHIMEATIEACEAYCTLAEMNRALRDIFGMYQNTLGATDPSSA